MIRSPSRERHQDCKSHTTGAPHPIRIFGLKPSGSSSRKSPRAIVSQVAVAGKGVEELIQQRVHDFGRIGIAHEILEGGVSTATRIVNQDVIPRLSSLRLR